MPTYHVATTGSDSADGSSGTPWATIGHAIAQPLSPGDVIEVAAGSYTENIQSSSGALDNGTDGNPITLRAATDATVTIVGGFRIRGQSWWVIERIGVDWDATRPDGDPSHMVRVIECTSCVVDGGTYTDARAYAALLIGGNTDCTFRNLTIHDTIETNGLNQDHGIYVSEGTSNTLDDGTIIEYCLIYDCLNGRGVKVGASASNRADPINGTIRYCTIVNTPGPSPLRFSYGATGWTVDRCVLVGPVEENAGYDALITSHSPDGGVVQATISNCWGYDPDGIATKLVQATAAFSVGTGNTFGTDPDLDPVTYAPQNPALTTGGVYQYGHLFGQNVPGPAEPPAPPVDPPPGVIAQGFMPIDVTGHFLAPNGDPATGYMVFELTERMTNSSTHEIVTTQPVQADIDGSGDIAVTLLATTGPGVLPGGAQYRMTHYSTGGAPLSESLVTIPHDAAGGTYDVSNG